MSKKSTFLDEMRAFNAFFLIFGLFASWPTPKYRPILFVYSIFSIFLVFAIFVSAVYINKVFNENILSSAVAYSFLLSILATHLIIVLQSLFHRKAQIKLVQKFSYVDRLFNTKLQLFISYRNEKRALFIRLLILLCTFLLIKSGLFIHLYYGGYLNSFWFHCVYSNWIARLRSAQVLFYVYLLRSRLILVNEKVKEILISRNRQSGNLNEWQPIVNKRNIALVFDTSSSKFSTYDRLLNLKQIYGELYEICELINITFGWSLLAIITQCKINDSKFTNQNH